MALLNSHYSQLFRFDLSISIHLETKCGGLCEPGFETVKFD